MMAHIMTLSQEPKYIKDHYIVIEKENKFILFIYDWRVLESESRNANYEKTDIYVDFKHKTNKNHLIKFNRLMIITAILIILLLKTYVIVINGLKHS